MRDEAVLRRPSRAGRELPDEPVLTLREAAEMLRISPSTAKKLAADGSLPGILPKVGAQWRVNQRVLLEFLATPAPSAQAQTSAAS